jgi:hypothetical protein
MSLPNVGIFLQVHTVLNPEDNIDRCTSSSVEINVSPLHCHLGRSLLYRESRSISLVVARDDLIVSCCEERKPVNSAAPFPAYENSFVLK